MMGTKDKVSTLCQKIQSYCHRDAQGGQFPVAVVGPDGTDPNKLRVYACGGLLGKIYFGNHPSGKNSLLTDAYVKYLPNAEEQDVFNKYLKKNSADIGDEIGYLPYAVKALRARFTGKERYTECEIAERFTKTGENWAVVDMEAYFTGSYFGSKQGERVDLVVLNRNGFGFVELKCNGESCSNLKKHYDYLLYIRDHPTAFRDEMIRRVDVMAQYGLLGEKVLSIYRELKEKNSIPVWVGCLFVGDLAASKKRAASELKQVSSLEQFQFLYCDSNALGELDMDQMDSYEKFQSM